jgi:hypothetical protein
MRKRPAENPSEKPLQSKPRRENRSISLQALPDREPVVLAFTFYLPLIFNVARRPKHLNKKPAAR